MQVSFTSNYQFHCTNKAERHKCEKIIREGLKGTECPVKFTPQRRRDENNIIYVYVKDGVPPSGKLNLLWGSQLVAIHDKYGKDAFNAKTGSIIGEDISVTYDTLKSTPIPDDVVEKIEEQVDELDDADKKVGKYGLLTTFDRISPYYITRMNHRPGLGLKSVNAIVFDENGNKKSRSIINDCKWETVMEIWDEDNQIWLAN